MDALSRLRFADPPEEHVFTIVSDFDMGPLDEDEVRRELQFDVVAKKVVARLISGDWSRN